MSSPNSTDLPAIVPSESTAPLTNDKPQPSDEDNESEKDSSTDSSQSTEPQISQPTTYEEYIDVISTLRSKGDLETLRSLYNQFSIRFPLRPPQWRLWISDELTLATTTDERQKALQLYHRAFLDFADSTLYMEALKKVLQFFQKKEVSPSCLAEILEIGLNCNIASQAGISNQILEKIHPMIESLSLEDINKETLDRIETCNTSLEQLDSLASNSIACQKFEERLSELSANGPSNWTGIADENIIAQYLFYAQCAENEGVAFTKGVYERAIGYAFLSEQVWNEYLSLSERLSDMTMTATVARRGLRHLPQWYRGWEAYTRIATTENELLEILKVSQANLSHLPEQAMKVAKWVATRAMELRLTSASVLNVLKENMFTSFIGTAEWASVMCHLASIFAATGGKQQAIDAMEEVVEQRESEPRWWISYINILERTSAEPTEVNKIFRRAVTVVSRSRDVDVLQDIWFSYIISQIGTIAQNISIRLAEVQDICDKERGRKAEEWRARPNRKERRGGAKSRTRAKPVAKRKKIDNTVQEQGPSSTTKKTDAVMVEPNEETQQKKQKDTENRADEKEQNVEPHTIFVSNIPFGATTEDLRTVFQSAGTIVSVRLPRRSDGASKGIAYIEFENDSAIEPALAMHNVPVRGRSVWVRRSRPPVRGRRAASRGSGVSRRARGHSGRRRLVIDGIVGGDKDIEMKELNADNNSKVAQDDKIEKKTEKSMTQDDFRAFLLKKS